jgi:hypothetical protein
LALIIAEQVGALVPADPAIPSRIEQFEQAATTGFAYLSELGQAVSLAEETLDIARSYLEIAPLKNLEKAKALTRQSLQTFQDFNRRKHQAATYKLLGEIHLACTQSQKAEAPSEAHDTLMQSLTLYQELDLSAKAVEVEQLMS